MLKFSETSKYQKRNYVKFKKIPEIDNKLAISNNLIGIAQIMDLDDKDAFIRYEIGPYPAAIVNVNLDEIEGIDWDEKYSSILDFIRKDDAFYYETLDFHYQITKTEQKFEVLLKKIGGTNPIFEKVFTQLHVHEVQNIYFNYTDEQTI